VPTVRQEVSSEVGCEVLLGVVPDAGLAIAESRGEVTDEQVFIRRREPDPPWIGKTFDLALASKAAYFFPRLVEMLRRCEVTGGDDGLECPICSRPGRYDYEARGHVAQHAPDCELAALLAEAEAGT